MDKVCERCQSLRLPLYKGDNIYTNILLNQQDDHDECAKALLEAGAEVNAESRSFGTALAYAARLGHVRRLQALIAAGADVNIPYYVFKWGCENALTNAVQKGYIKCVELLIKAGADVNKVGDKERSILNFAIERLDAPCVNVLIEAGANVNYSETPPLHSAVVRNAKKCTDLLLKSGAAVNARESALKTTALMLVKGVECCRLPFIYGAQIGHTDCNDYNALTSYMSHNKGLDKDVCSLLFAAGETTPEVIEKSFPLNGNETLDVVEYLPEIQIKFYLKHLCREAIRKHLLNLDPHTHLFGRIPKIGLPKSLTEYLLYYMSLDSSSLPDNDENQ